FAGLEREGEVIDDRLGIVVAKRDALEVDGEGARGERHAGTIFQATGRLEQVLDAGQPSAGLLKVIELVGDLVEGLKKNRGIGVDHDRGAEGDGALAKEVGRADKG